MDVSAQGASWYPLTYYFDAERTCQDCERPFLFFAEEQRLWYQVLAFLLGADAVRCVPCRKVAQGTSRLIERYHELIHAQRDAAQQFEFAEAIMGML